MKKIEKWGGEMKKSKYKQIINQKPRKEKWINKCKQAGAKLFQALLRLS